MMPISGTAINGCDCPGTGPVSGVLIDGIIPSIDTTQRGTWASDLFSVNKNGQDSFMIGFQFSTNINVRNIEVTYLDCQIWRAGTSAIDVYSSFLFPSFIQSASTHIGELSLIDDVVQSCTSLMTVSISTQPMTASNIYYVKFSFTGVSRVHPLNWLHLAEIGFSDEDTPSTFITTSTTMTKHTPSSTIYSECQATINASGSGSLELNDGLPNFTNVTTSSEEMSTTLGSSDVSAIHIISIVGGLVGIIAVLLLLLIIGGAFIAYLVVHHRHNLNKLISDSSIEHHYAVIENPNNNSTPSLELQNPSNPGGEERRPSTAINSLYEPTPEISDHTNSDTLPVGVPGGDVVYSEIRDMPGMHDSGTRSMAEEVAQDTSSIDLYDDDDDSIQESHYAIIPEMYMLATPINQVKLNVRSKSADVSLAAASHGESQDQESKESYWLVHKQSECPPPIPEKSTELQQYLTVKMITAAEESDQQQQCRGQTNANPDNGTQAECLQ